MFQSFNKSFPDGSISYDVDDDIFTVCMWTNKGGERHIHTELLKSLDIFEILSTAIESSLPNAKDHREAGEEVK